MHSRNERVLILWPGPIVTMLMMMVLAETKKERPSSAEFNTRVFGS